MKNTIEFTRVKNDTYGNPRFVVHFFALNTQEERTNYDTLSVSDKYNLALKRARKIGGKKFHNKQFGGGIVFQCYSIPRLVEDIQNITGSKFDEVIY